MPERYEGPERRSYEDGRVDAQLASHEQRLAAINGSIERHARSVSDLARGMSHLRDEVRKLASTQATQESVDAAVAQRTEKSQAKRWQLIGAGIAFATMLVMLSGILVTLLTQGGHP